MIVKYKVIFEICVNPGATGLDQMVQNPLKLAITVLY